MAAKKKAADDEVRSRIIDGAVRLIESQGLANLSMREVAREAGVSHQAPYHWFADREAILATIAENGFVELGERMKAARKKGKTATEGLALLGEAYVRFALERKAHFRVMFRADTVDLNRFPVAKACAEKAFGVVPEMVANAIAEGVPPEPSPMALVVLGWSLCHGIACLLLDGPLERKLPELGQSPEEITHDVMSVLQRMMDTSAKKKSPRRARSRP